MNVLSLFSGVGGFDLGFVNGGFNVVYAIESDRQAARMFSKNFPETKVINADIQTIQTTQIYQDIHVIIGGSPCQGYSIAGKQNSNDPRNHLIFDYVRFVLELLPKYFVFENVPLLTKSDNFKKFLEILSEEYYIEYKILDASDYGVPQVRKRLIVIGTRFDMRSPQFPVPQENKVTLEMAISDLPNIEDVDELNYKDSVFIEHGEPTEYSLKLNGSQQKKRLLTCSMKTRHDYSTRKHFERMTPGEPDIDRRVKPFYDKPSPTVIAHRKLVHPMYNRFLTTREVARVQSFPDWFQFNSNLSTGCRQVGNAVPPLLSQAIAVSII